MQLKTVEDLVQMFVTHADAGLFDNMDTDGTFLDRKLVTDWLFLSITQIITQDRADTRAVLRDGVDLKREPINTDTKEVNEANSIYNQALDDILTLIDTLLPGDVSKPTEEIPGFEGTLQALGKI